MLAGRYAGRKAVIVKAFDDGAGSRKYGHAIVVGIDSYPSKVTKSMTKKQVARRSHVKAFVKPINYTHLMPTRYSLDVDFGKTVNAELFDKKSEDAVTKKRTALSEVKIALQDRYKQGKNKWFFSKLRF